MRTYIVSDEPQLRSAIQFLLDHQPHIKIVADIDKQKLLLAQIEASQPELIMLDWDMFGQATVDLLTNLCVLPKRPKILVLSLRSDVEQLALQAGADLFFNKGDSPEKLVTILGNFGQKEVSL
ncbi:MAG: response regulator transcription factor [Anaerolineae bacterium]|nr:response regulator transcription factor [Anaerolineae bacterium]